MHPAEARVARPADLVARNAVAPEELWQQAGRGSVHGVENDAQFRGPQPFPIHQFFQRIEIRRARFERMDEILAWWKRRHAFFQDASKFLFNLRDDRGQRAAAVACFVFDSVPEAGSETRGDSDAARAL